MAVTRVISWLAANLRAFCAVLLLLRCKGPTNSRGGSSEQSAVVKTRRTKSRDLPAPPICVHNAQSGRARRSNDPRGARSNRAGRSNSCTGSSASQQWPGQSNALLWRRPQVRILPGALYAPSRRLLCRLTWGANSSPGITRSQGFFMPESR
jgi:hypothetical protein